MRDRWPVVFAMTVSSLAVLATAVTAGLALSQGTAPAAFGLGIGGMLAASLGMFAIIRWMLDAGETYPDYRYRRAIAAGPAGFARARRRRTAATGAPAPTHSAGELRQQRRRLRSDARPTQESSGALIKSPAIFRGTVKLASPCFADCSNFYQKPILLYGPLSGFALEPGSIPACGRTHERPRQRSEIPRF